MNDSNIGDRADVDSKTIYKKILDAFKMQKSRGQKELNGKLDEDSIKQFCNISDELQQILNRAIKEFELSYRATNKILKVSRTIADLDLSNTIEKKHLLEAISYRKR